MTDAQQATTGTARGAARRRLVTEHIGFARYLAARYRGRGVGDEDLDQVAYVGLVKAAARFDPSREAAFTTFAGPTIEGEIRRHFRDHSWAVRVPRGVKDLTVAIRQAAEELSHSLGRSPLPREIARHLDVDLDDVVEALGASGGFRAASLDTRRGAREHYEAGGTEPSREEDADFARVEDRVNVDRLMASLPEREREIVRLSYFEGLTQSEIGERVELSQMHVSRLLRRALETMRAAAEGTP